MISDVLADAVHSLDSYLNDRLFDEVYKGELRERILRCRAEMDAIRAILDTPPTGHGPDVLKTKNAQNGG